MPWRAHVSGHPFDLELLVEQFDRGRARVVRAGEEFWLESPSFDGLPDAPAVQRVASELLKEMNRVAKLIDGSFRSVELQDRFSDGTGSHVLLVVGSAEVRARAAKVAAVGVVRDAQGDVVPSGPPTPTEAPVYLDLAGREPSVREVMQLLSGDHPDWFTLYKVKEVMEADAGGLGAFTTRGELRAFSASANRPDVSGEAARHARQKGGPPRHAMTIDEGRAFIRRIAKAWLASKDRRRRAP